MILRMGLLLISLALLSCGGGSSTTSNYEVRVGFWELSNWGLSKAADSTILGRAAEVINRYDLIAVSDVSDSSGTSITTLLSAVNSEAGGDIFDVSIGTRVGRTTSKRQYLVFFKKAQFSVVEKYEFTAGTEPVGDTYEREPLMLHLQQISSGDKFMLIVLDTKSTDVINELDGLPDVYSAAASRFGISSALMVGNFNADCSYLDDTNYANLSLVGGPAATNWAWQTSRLMDTTTGATDCGYSHILTGYGLTSNGVASVYNLETGLGIIAADAQALSSQHPVEVTIRF